MARQLITLVKFIRGIDRDLDQAVDALTNPDDLASLVAPARSGRGMLYWASYYDPWLVFHDFDLNRFGIICSESDNRVSTIDLQSQGWASLPGSEYAPQWHEQRWLIWHLHEAYNTFRDQNNRATLLLGRSVIGGSLGDDELLRDSL